MNYLNPKSIAVLLFGVFLIFTESKAQKELSASKRDNFKQAVRKTVRENSSLSGKFTQVQKMDYVKSDVRSSGIFFYKKPDKLKWSYTTPFSYSLVFNEGEITINNSGEKTKMTVASNPLFKKLSELIAESINGGLLSDSDFKARYRQVHNLIVVKLTPVKNRSGMADIFSEVDLYFNKESTLVEKIKLMQPDGDFTLIHLRDVKINEPMLKKVFKN